MTRSATAPNRIASPNSDIIAMPIRFAQRFIESPRILDKSIRQPA
jgi:hypothetical protein